MGPGPLNWSSNFHSLIRKEVYMQIDHSRLWVLSLTHKGGFPPVGSDGAFCREKFCRAIQFYLCCPDLDHYSFHLVSMY